MTNLKKIARRIIPVKVYENLSNTKEKIEELWYQILAVIGHYFSLKKIRCQKRPINVVFFAIDASVWKYDSLYSLFVKDDRYYPIVLICPQVNLGNEHMRETMEKCYHTMKERGYNVVCSYNEDVNSYLDSNVLNPDIIFYTNPYEGLILNKYYIKKNIFRLTCYVNYGFNQTCHKWNFSLLFHKVLWRYYCEFDFKPQMKAIHEYLLIDNQRVTGYPMYDQFSSNIIKDSIWKISDSKYKRVIWAPHHTIEEDNQYLRFSSFLKTAEYMAQIREKYRDKLQFVFRPHPLLKAKLYKLPTWGKERTDKYYASWENSSNSCMTYGDYVDLFKSSDAMIHDCASFTIEYLYVNKPVMYLASSEHALALNEVGKNAFNCHYQMDELQDIDNFIEDVVINGSDNLMERRKSFYSKYLVPVGGRTVAESIINDLNSAIFR